MERERTDPASRPDVTAEALAKAAIQTTQRALFTAQLAAEAMRKAAGEEAAGTNGQVWRLMDAEAMGALRDALLDAFTSIPKEKRDKLSACKATITSDELIDLLALSVQGQ